MTSFENFKTGKPRSASLQTYYEINPTEYETFSKSHHTPGCFGKKTIIMAFLPKKPYFFVLVFTPATHIEWEAGANTANIIQVPAPQTC